MILLKTPMCGMTVEKYFYEIPMESEPIQKTVNLHKAASDNRIPRDVKYARSSGVNRDFRICARQQTEKSGEEGVTKQ